MAVNCCLIGLGQIGMGYDFDDEHTIIPIQRLLTNIINLR